MVRDGYFYGVGCLLAAGLITWLAGWPYAVPVLLLAAFLLWFFRDPERQIPTLAGAVVSPGDGKVTDVSLVTSDGASGGVLRHRISIFLSVFDVHVNRSPIAGVIRDVRYQRGKFLNAMGARFGGRKRAEHRHRRRRRPHRDLQADRRPASRAASFSTSRWEIALRAASGLGSSSLARAWMFCSIAMPRFK